VLSLSEIDATGASVESASSQWSASIASAVARLGSCSSRRLSRNRALGVGDSVVAAFHDELICDEK